MPNENNEDQIIATGLLSIKKGILAGDWGIVCSGYETITGEKLTAKEKPKSRLESIRSLMNIEKDDEDEDNDGTPVPAKLPKPKPTDWSNKTVKELKQELINRKVDFGKTKKKNDLIALIQLSDDTDDEDEPDIGDLTTTKLKGGKVFGQNFQVLSDGFDPREALENKKRAKKKIRNTVKRQTKQKDTSKDEDADFRFYDKPPKKAPWH